MRNIHVQEWTTVHDPNPSSPQSEAGVSGAGGPLALSFLYSILFNSVVPATTDVSQPAPTHLLLTFSHDH
jgi:hypothetical protein